MTAAAPPRPPAELDRISLYVRLASTLRSRINDGEWAPGARLPTIKELAEQYEVAPITVREALGVLAADGLIVSSRGRGTFVTEGARPVRGNLGLRAAINDRLGLSPGQTIQILGRDRLKQVPPEFGTVATPRYPEYVRVRKLHLHEDEPFALLAVLLAAPLYARLPPRADERTKLLRLILDHGRVRLSESRIEITLAYADHATATLLRCAPTAALVRIRSWRVDETGRFVFGHVSLYRGDRFIYETVEHEPDLSRTSTVVLPGMRAPEAPPRRRLRDTGQR
ncbi:GntR family transcriptional regulator [Caldovatus sediminis]|uniref:GntR family transcriptional regulator n=1 Tax=Caldovatus sediminis TaxID=2041189 RepID=A0A8J2ZE70_9PROT|nr:GntR family transcriptional regulator [Caldovatus sediminis]GGG44215.1 GntR family transcriptional regulator [Caldovatus sediminis]